MTSEHQPRCDGAVHTLEVVLQEGVLGRGGIKGVLCAHQDKVDAAVVEPIPTEQGRVQGEAKLHYTLWAAADAAETLYN